MKEIKAISICGKCGAVFEGAHVSQKLPCCGGECGRSMLASHLLNKLDDAELLEWIRREAAAGYELAMDDLYDAGGDYDPNMGHPHRLQLPELEGEL